MHWGGEAVVELCDFGVRSQCDGLQIGESGPTRVTNVTLTG